VWLHHVAADERVAGDSAIPTSVRKRVASREDPKAAADKRDEARHGRLR
jgi:hypothetical protein